MSRRITNKLNITDRDLAIEALQLANYTYRENGNTLYIDNGALRNARLNLTTGEMSGDSDFGHTEEQFGLLRQYYAEAQVRSECLKSGVTIDERQTDSEGNIVLMAHMA
jgi:hypothetical protein